MGGVRPSNVSNSSCNTVVTNQPNMGHRYSKHSVVTIQPTSTLMNSCLHQMHQQNLANKRAVIRNNRHINLMSLDENALNLYRDQHRMLMNAAAHNMPNMTIPENNALIEGNNEDVRDKSETENNVKTQSSRKVSYRNNFFKWNTILITKN
jgi:hypothetical protein